jgi:hypothetical protein
LTKKLESAQANLPILLQRERLEEWKIGRMEEWKIGRMEEWKNGRVEEWASFHPPTSNLPLE